MLTLIKVNSSESFINRDQACREQYVLTGLDSSDYESLVTSMLARGDKISLDEIYSLLLNQENRVEQ